MAGFSFPRNPATSSSSSFSLGTPASSTPSFGFSFAPSSTPSSTGFVFGASSSSAAGGSNMFGSSTSLNLTSTTQSAAPSFSSADTIMSKCSSVTNIKVEALPSDIISNLPPNIIQTMLTLMPMRDAFRTSILSRNWRGHCVNMPKLIFDDQMFLRPDLIGLSNKCKLSHVIYPILLLHQGSILEFSLCLSKLRSCCQIDQIILYLSRNDTLKKFTLCIGEGDDHKLRPSFFSLQQLTHLKLRNCAFQPPVMFKGFSKLISLYFDNVSVSQEVLLHFIINCPLLKSFTLIADEKHLIGSWNSDFAELFECLPLLEHLHMSSFPVKCFAKGVMPHKLPTSLVYLKILHLSGLHFAREDELQSALLLVLSSPNIKKVKLEMYYDPWTVVSQTAMDLVDVQDYSDVRLGHLCELEITNFSNTKPQMDFVKLILTKSHMLKKLGIVIKSNVSIQEEVKILKDLVRYPRASTKAEIVFVRP